LTDPQVAANHLIVESEHPHAGPMRQPRPAARFEATPAALRLFAPTLGQHTDAVLEEAGIAAADRAALRASGIIS
jgi:crotonobetainyl-CoA:carnitine CoA-transferase CaiB-like acyl-CoA transferase